jgi:RNA polymerase sigma-70 factor, ECF subfamily
VQAVNSALQRARKTVDDRLPKRSQLVTLRALGDERVRELVETYADALERGDLDAVLALLTEDAAWSMPPMPGWYRGHAAIAGFMRQGPMNVGWRHLPTRANGQIAVGCYAWKDETRTFRAEVLDVLTLRDGTIAQVTAFIGADVLPRFGLPAELT